MIRARQREARTSKGQVSQSFPMLFRLAVYPSHLRKWRSCSAELETASGAFRLGDLPHFPSLRCRYSADLLLAFSTRKIVGNVKVGTTPNVLNIAASLFHRKRPLLLSCFSEVGKSNSSSATSGK